MVRKKLRVKKAGHCGTLDPFATGVLPVCINQATRIVDQLLIQDKVYRCTIRFGIETDTLDRTGKVVRRDDSSSRSADELERAIDGFRGTFIQEVPRFAAVHVQGRRLYEWSRSGIEVELPKREVCVHDIRLLSYSWPEATLEVHCGKGTYIRQLAADIGRVLECGAHVAELRRLACGPFREEMSISPEHLEEFSGGNICHERLLSMNDALAHLPAVVIDDEATLHRLSNGVLDPDWEAEYRPRFQEESGPVRILSGERRLAALWWPHPEEDQRRHLRVFHS